MTATPFLKWAGGKSKLLPVILERLPLPAPGRYYFEPFLGGGAVFFARAEEMRAVARLSDANRWLIETYRAVRDEASAVLGYLESFKNTEEDYYRLRSLDVIGTPAFDTAFEAARFIFLNKTCFNGLFRLNAAGKFNVPWCRDPDQRFLFREQILEASAALQRVTLDTYDFTTSIAQAQEGDVVYADPPYLPKSKTADFTKYVGKGFSLEDHKTLAEALCAASKRGAFVLLSASSAEASYEVYGPLFDLSHVSARRSISSKSSTRGPIAELLGTPRGQKV